MDELHKSRIRDVYQHWDPSNPNTEDADGLHEEVLTDYKDGMIGAILGFHKDPHDATRVVACVYHNVTTHPCRGSPFRGKVFAYVNDVQDFDIETVLFKGPDYQVPDKYEEMTGVRTWKNIDDYSTKFAADPDLQRVVAPTGLDAADDDVSKTIVTRRTMFVPFELVPFILTGGPPMTIREVIATVLPAIQATGLDDVCDPLVDYLMVVATRGQDGTFQEPVMDDAGGLPAGAVEVSRHRRRAILSTQLPALRPAVGADPTLHALLGSMKDIRNSIVVHHNELSLDRHDKNQRLTVEKRWPDKTLDRLCKMCKVANSHDLPPLWHELAGYKKTDGTNRNVIQDAVDRASAELGIPHCPVVTVQHATAIAGFSFVGQGDQELGAGVLPFSIIPPNQVSATAVASLQQAHNQNMDYNTIMTGSTSITSADASKMRSAKGYIPSNFEEMLVQVAAYGCLLGALLGTNHPNVKEHQGAVNSLIRNQALIKQFVTAQHGAKLGSATVLYYFQLRHRAWFVEQWRYDTTNTRAPPSLNADLQKFSYTYKIGFLPRTEHVAILQQLARKPATAVVATTAESNDSPGGSSGGSSNEGGGGSSTGNGNGRSRVSNRNRDARVMGEVPLARRIREKSISEALGVAGGPPDTTGGNVRCLSWHLKGKCYSDCPRKADHVVLPTEDADMLVEWCQRAFP
jgi:uncharacterized membrane protein YgcG